MAGFKEIIGQEHIVNHMKNAIKLNKVSHSYMICGEKGMGKKMIADGFSMLLQCEGNGDEPCMECRSCKQSISKNQPDIKWIYHEKPNTISVEEVREQLVNDIVIKPYSSKYKVYIIDEAEKMSPAAQNAILKTIEEPPAYGIILLLTENREMMLETIRSRCVLLEVRPVKKQEFKQYFQIKKKIPDYETDTLAEFSGGNIGKAISMLENSEYENMREHIAGILKNIEKKDAAQINGLMKEAVEFKNDVTGYIDLLTMWFRDILLYKSVGSKAKLIFSDESSSIKSKSGKYSYEALNIILDEINILKSRLSSNVNFELSVEMLYLRIRDLLTD